VDGRCGLRYHQSPGVIWQISVMEQAGNNEASEQWGERTRRLTRKWFWAPMLVGAVALLVAVWAWSQVEPDRVSELFDTLVDVDLNQGRIDTALPIPRGELTISQGFVPRHDGLQEIELTLARYGETTEIDNGRLTLQLLAEDSQVLGEKKLETAALAHNQVVKFPFPRQTDSAGQPYTLKISGNPQNTMSVWGYSLDSYGGGAVSLQGDQADGDAVLTTAQDLRFLTRYHLTWLGALNSLGETFYFEGLLFLLALIFLPMPGCLLLFLFHKRWISSLAGQAQTDGNAWPWDPAAWWGTALALGIAAWPLLWLWLTLIGGRWSGWLLWLVIAAGWFAVGWLWWRDRKERRQRIEKAEELSGLPPHPPLTLSWRTEHLILLIIILLGLAVRLLAVRDVAFPPWVDSSRHALITAVMVESGQAISEYMPFLPVDRFPYHFGFHALSGSLALMSAWPLERLLLYLGQLLNALVPLALYAAVWLATRRQGAGLLAAFLAALPLFFPAYYATWGRFTQLIAVYVLPILLALSWRLVRGKGQWQRVWWLVALLAAGLFLAHFRVFLYYIPFALLVWLVSLGRNSRWLAMASGLALLLIAPRLIQLLIDTNPVQLAGRTIANYNNFPASYFTTGWERAFVAAAAAGLVLAIIAAIRRRRWTVLPLVLVAWVAVLFLLLSVDRIGVPVTSLVNLNSMYIILFVPLAMFLAIVVEQVWRWLRQQHWLLQLAGYVLAGALLAAMFLFGVRQQISILNVQTILAQPEDVAGLLWVDANLPPEASIAVNSWRWLGETWAAADAGAWLLPLTGRSASTPPIDHIYNRDLFKEVRKFNEAANAVSDWSDPAQADWLREQGFGYVFIGKKGGFFDPAVLARNPKMEMLYGRLGVFVFGIDD
jgi:hypothetical protein